MRVCNTYARVDGLKTATPVLKARVCFILFLQAILGELNGAQGEAMDIGGYFRPNDELALKWMRASPTFNTIIDGV